MKIRQISVFLENRKGRLYSLCCLLGEKGINIRALNIAETTDFGIIRMVVDKTDEAYTLLKENSFVASIAETVAVEVEDKPGGLAEVLKVISESDVNVEYMYGFLEKRSDKAMLVFRFDDVDNAVKLMQEKGISVVSSSEIQEL